MLCFVDWLLSENIQIVFASDDFPEEEMGIDYQTMVQESWQLAKNSPINILSNKDLNSAAILNGNVVGALFDSWDIESDTKYENRRDVYSFDVIGSPTHQQQGVGKKLINVAMSNFNADSMGRDDPYIKAEVVNPNLIPLLTRLGFKTIQQVKGITIMVFGKDQ